MFLSTLLIDVGTDPDRPRPGRLWLRDAYRVHQRLCMAFPSPVQKQCDSEFMKPFDPHGFGHVHERRTIEQAFLFRIDPVAGGNPVIAVQSATNPGWDYAFHNAGHLLAGPPQVTAWEPIFVAGESRSFRLAANPTRRLRETSKGPDGNTVNEAWVGKRVPVAEGQVGEWLTRQAQRGGFQIERWVEVRTSYVHMVKRPAGEIAQNDNAQRAGRLRYVVFEGILTVRDHQAFMRTVVSGVGPAKGFGCGLLSVGPVRD
jgi:CRISPR system Cascade subunit CasE